MKYKRYIGEFVSHSGVTWRAEIWQEATAAYSSIGDLDFDADDPLVINWDEKDKEEVICGSTAEIHIISTTDRQYIDLYSIEVGQIRLDVYRNNVLYWSGCLDPEFYEEPYESLNGYTVSLTFSDFGIWERIKYNLIGIQTLQSILIYALSNSGINYGSLEASALISTTFQDGTKCTPDSLSIRSDNFKDEDGELSTLSDVVTSILQPLGLKIIQRAGVVSVYDLNGIYHVGTSRCIVWDGSSSTLGTDKVSHHVIIKFSPYSKSELLSGDISYTGKTSADAVNFTGTSLEDATYGEYYTYFPKNSSSYFYNGSSVDEKMSNFTIFVGTGKGKGISYAGAPYFKILPLENGPEESSGIAAHFENIPASALGTEGFVKHGEDITHAQSSAEIMRSHQVYLPKIDSDSMKKYFVRVSQEILLDARYNPFQSTGDGKNEDGAYNQLKVWAGWVFVPVAISIKDSTGNTLYHYSNQAYAEKASFGSLRYAQGSWKTGSATWGECWLSWYNTDGDMKEDCGVMGWKANRHCIGRLDDINRINKDYFPTNFSAFNGDTFYNESFLKMADGEYIPYPPCGGYLEVSIYNGIWGYDFGESCDWLACKKWVDEGLYSKLRWLLYKGTKIEVVNNNITFSAAESEDIQYSGYINKYAKDNIEIESKCGTLYTPDPSAKGAYYKTSDSLQIENLTREGVTDHPEKLLIGTLISQYDGRKTTLSGDTTIDSDKIGTFTEQNLSGKIFIIKGEEQNALTDVSEATFVELVPDSYDSIEEVEE